MSRCKCCGADIVWIKTRNGKKMPCDPIEMLYWEQEGGPEKIVTDNGDVVSARLYGESGKATGIGLRSHFATCTKQ